MGHPKVFMGDWNPGDPLPEGLELPERQVRYLYVVDDDMGQCYLMHEDDVPDVHVDMGIESATVRPDWVTIDVDDQPTNIVYANGRFLELQMRWVDTSGSARPDHYRLSGGFLFPADSGGSPIYDAANTPNLAEIRRDLNEQAQQRRDDREELAELVNTFAGFVSAGDVIPQEFWQQFDD